VGNVVGNLLNFGTLSPGNSPGTLTVNGNFSQGPNGVFNVEILSARNYSRLVVTGHASLDGTLHLTLASGFRPAPGESFTVLSARQGISGTFRTISSNTPVSVTYANGVVDVNTTSATQPTQKAQIHLSDGTPNSTTALLADYTFYGFGSLSERMALGLSPAEETGKNNAVSLTFDAGEFDFQGQHGQTYTIPIAGRVQN
jgi:outer membrane autotransporter protein